MRKLLMAGFLWSTFAGTFVGTARADNLAAASYYAGLAGADLYSTARAESRGAVEANPLMRAQGSRYALKVAQVGVLTFLDHKAGKRSKKLQWTVRIIAGAVTAGAVIHNNRQGR